MMKETTKKMTKEEVATICMEWKHRIDETISMSDWLYPADEFDYDLDEIEKLAHELWKKWSLEHFGKVYTDEDF